MFFQNRKGWHCQFLEEDPLPRRFTFGSEEKVKEMAKRGGATLNLETLQALDHGIEIGRGGIRLKLTQERYARLLKK
jgi:hypothetical protein